MTKNMIVLIASTLFTITAAQQALAASAKTVTMPEDCVNVVKNVAAASVSANYEIDPADVTVTGAVVTKKGTIPPSDGYGPTEYSGVLKIAGETSGTVKVRLIRGGCMVTRFQQN